MPRQKTISLAPDEYQRLREIKEETEERLGANFDWGAFILGAITGGIIGGIVADIVASRQQSQQQSQQEKKKIP